MSFTLNKSVMQGFRKAVQKTVSVTLNKMCLVKIASNFLETYNDMVTVENKTARNKPFLKL